MTFRTDTFSAEEDIHDLSPTVLSKILFAANKEQTPIPFIESKNHYRFLQDYLFEEGVNAKFVVSERHYINKDYLSDYSSYYSTCFHGYEKVCTRLHFFAGEQNKEEFTEEFIAIIVEGKENKAYDNFWQERYLGYVVIKPTPNYFIGYTILKHYNYSRLNKSLYDEGRDFWGVRDYPVHVFGNSLTISSLGFLEQDKNVAACATISIWCMLQRAAEDYYVTLRSPSEITLDGGAVAFDGNRLLPNKGLSVLQMAKTITKNKLATEVRQKGTHKSSEDFTLYICKLIHAYKNLKIPIILVMDVPDEHNKYEKHAVAVNGYHLRHVSSIIPKPKKICGVAISSSKPKGIIWRAGCIDKLYAHDDQWGPFARIGIGTGLDLHTSWSDNLPQRPPCLAATLLISVYPKVRVAYEDIENRVIGINRIFIDNVDEDINWDIQLHLSEEFKSDIQTNSLLNDEVPTEREIQYKLLTMQLPKYIWVATMYIGETMMFQFVFDATGLSGSNIILTILGFYKGPTDFFIDALKTNLAIKDMDLMDAFDYDIQSYIDATLVHD